MFVYLIINDINGKIYIGKTITGNLKKYLRDKVRDAATGKYNGISYLYNAMKRHGGEHFHIYPLISSLTTNADLCFYERVLITQYNTQNSDIGYNICRGGEGRNVPNSEGWKQKMRVIMKAKWEEPGYRKRVVKSMKEAPKTPEQLACLNRSGSSNYSPDSKEKMRQSHLNPPQELRDRIAATLRTKIALGEFKPPTTKGLKLSSESYRGRIPWNKGKIGVQKRSEETKRKISATMKERRIVPKNRTPVLGRPTC